MEKEEFIKKAREYLEYNHIDCSRDIILIDSGCYMQPMIIDPKFKEVSSHTLHEVAISLAYLTNQKIEYVDN